MGREPKTKTGDAEMNGRYLILNADARRIPLADKSVHCCVTSPPYWGLRDYGVDGQIGMESTPDGFVASMVAVFREVRRVLRDDGTCWLNLGDSYGGDRVNKTPSPDSKYKSLGSGSVHGHARNFDFRKHLVGIPWRVAFALQADGWYLRSEIIWNKPNAMPESVIDRPTRGHEHVFLFAKSDRYSYDADAVREPVKQTTLDRDKYSRITKGKDGPYAVAHDHETPSNPDGRNMRSVWTISTHSYPGAHFATMPPALASRCIKAGCPQDGITLDPFNGAATTGVVALSLGRRYIGLELNKDYIAQSIQRIERPHAPIVKASSEPQEVPFWETTEEANL